MKSKLLLTFLNRIANLATDVEFVDVINIALNQKRLHDDNHALPFHDVQPEQHPHLAVRKNTRKSRILVVRHLKSTLYASFIKEIYEEVTLYFKGLLICAAKNGTTPERLVGEQKSNLSNTEILKTGSWDKLLELIVSNIIQQLENERSTIDLIKKMNAKLNLAVPDSIINAALPFLELRHVLVHSDSAPSPEFTKKFPQFVPNQDGFIELAYKDVLEAAKALTEMIKSFDRQAGKGKIFAAEDLQKGAKT